MKYVASAFARILSILALLIFFAGPLYADPTILVSPSDTPNPTPWPTNPDTGFPDTVVFTTEPRFH